MAVRKEVGTFTVDGSILHDVSGYFGVDFALYPSGDDGGGTVTILGGNSTFRELVKVLDVDGTETTLAAMSFEAAYQFQACCTMLEFVLAGSTAPNLVVSLFVEPRR